MVCCGVPPSVSQDYIIMNYKLAFPQIWSVMYSVSVPQNLFSGFKCVTKKWGLGLTQAKRLRTTGLLVKADGSWPRGCWFEPQHLVLSGYKKWCKLLHLKNVNKGSQMGHTKKIIKNLFS